MKQLKKALALMLALTVVFAYSAVGAFAADGYTVTINQNAQDKGTHTYGAYQIFAGDLDATSGKLSNIVWGSGITDAGKRALGDAEAYAKTLTDASKAAAAANVLSQYLTSPEKKGSTTIEGLQGGYYLIKDEDNSPSGADPKAQTKFILKVINNTTVDVKSSVPSVDKKIKEGNNKTVVGDYNVGDEVEYEVTGTIGSGIDNFDKYSFQFVDTMSKGLTLDQNSWDIKVDETSIKDLFKLTSAAGENGATVWTWAATDIKAKVSSGKEVVLTYKATLNKDAVVGGNGNPNTVTLKFDNNPNNCGNGTPGGDTPPSKAVVFTYKTIFNKVKQDGVSPLTGADFKLEKKVGDKWVDVTNLRSGENNPTKEVSTAGTQFTFSGLGDGEYKLTETTTPSGYNTMDPIVFTISATFNETATPISINTLTGTDGKEFTMTPDKSAGSLTQSIINKEGSELPSTGGIGTTIFYIIGAILVLGAGVLLITRRRMQAR